MVSGLFAQAQGEDAAGATNLTGVNLANFASIAPSLCGSTVYNLGASTSPQAPANGTMSNDVWFQFTANATTAKVKVCSPSFDAAIEVWNSAGTVMLGSANIGGSGAKEYLCVSSLTVGTTYKVRVGRVSGSGAGTFSIQYEFFGVEVRFGYYPDPPGSATCYDFTTGIQRTFLSFAVGSTRWTFVDGSGTTFGPFTLGYLITLSQTPGICEGQTYQVYVEVQANDSECGNIWWGTSVPRPITTCATPCPVVTANSGANSCNSTFCNIFNTDFSCTYMGTGWQYQFRFVTDNGATDFCTAWLNNPIFSTSTLPYSDYFRYNKIYQVYVRTRLCATNPSWCGPCIFNTCSMPYVSVTNTSCCKWRNKSSGGTINATPITGMDQYRFRFTPVDPCGDNPYQPTGPAFSSNWSSSFAVNPAGYPLVLGTVYNVQVQCRVLASNATNCSGSTVSLPGQQTDWGLPCLIGIRSSTSPAVGSSVNCCTVVNSMTIDEYFRGDELREIPVYETAEDIAEDIESTVAEPELHVLDASGSGLLLDVEDASLFGDGTIDIYNASGQIVSSAFLYSMHQNSTLEVPVHTDLPAGIYIASIHNEYGRVSCKFFIGE